MRKTLRGRYGAGACAGLFLAVFLLAACSQRLVVRYYTEETGRVTGPVRLAVLTDLHSTFYGKEQEELVRTLEEQRPDAVLLVGDIADDQVPHRGTEVLLAAIGNQYPCFYVTGNHEYWSGEEEEIKKLIASYGAEVLEGESRLLTTAGQEIWICGVDDPDGYGQRHRYDPEAMAEWENQLMRCRLALDGEHYAVLMTHRPELVSYYTHTEEDELPGFDLVTAGHAHGGQVRIPGILNGLLAPNQGWFPGYAGGRYVLGDTVMIVSRGLCRNLLPRVFNRPELVIVDVVPAEQETDKRTDL
ncbi:MAG: metallophosphoesterase [Lachnospiraceae bacterium]|nr:metallophosphoesterase [Lachnospiraceae bacterium]